jgi:predicted RNA-binding protein YlqC (UPF0109 family)
MENKMNSISELIETMIKAIVDDPAAVSVSEVSSPKGPLFEVKVGASDVGKIIGKQGRIANAIRTIAKAAGAKSNQRVMVNVLNKSA